MIVKKLYNTPTYMKNKKIKQGQTYYTYVLNARLNEQKELVESKGDIHIYACFITGIKKGSVHFTTEWIGPYQNKSHRMLAAFFPIHHYRSKRKTLTKAKTAMAIQNATRRLLDMIGGYGEE